MDDRLITSSMTMEDEQIEYSLRPRFLNEYIGQHNVKEHMRIYIEAAKHRGEPLDVRPSNIPCRRPCGHTYKSRPRRRAVHRRDTQAEFQR